jgi:hypothetical protein
VCATSAFSLPEWFGMRALRVMLSLTWKLLSLSQERKGGQERSLSYKREKGASEKKGETMDVSVCQCHRVIRHTSTSSSSICGSSDGSRAPLSISIARARVLLSRLSVFSLLPCLVCVLAFGIPCLECASHLAFLASCLACECSVFVIARRKARSPASGQWLSPIHQCAWPVCRGAILFSTPHFGRARAS